MSFGHEFLKCPCCMPVFVTVRSRRKSEPCQKKFYSSDREIKISGRLSDVIEGFCDDTAE